LNSKSSCYKCDKKLVSTAWAWKPPGGGAWAGSPPENKQETSLLASVVEFTAKVSPKADAAVDADQQKMLEFLAAFTSDLRAKKEQGQPMSLRFKVQEQKLAKAKKKAKAAEEKVQETKGKLQELQEALGEQEGLLAKAAEEVNKCEKEVEAAKEVAKEITTRASGPPMQVRCDELPAQLRSSEDPETKAKVAVMDDLLAKLSEVMRELADTIKQEEPEEAPEEPPEPVAAAGVAGRLRQRQQSQQDAGMQVDEEAQVAKDAKDNRAWADFVDGQEISEEAKTVLRATDPSKRPRLG